MTPLDITATCEYCGFIYEYVEDWDSHPLRCHGPVTLRHLPDGTIIGEVGSD